MENRKADTVGELCKEMGLDILATLIGIFPEGINDDVFDFSTVEVHEPRPGERFILDLQMPEMILHCLNYNCNLKIMQLKNEMPQAIENGAEGGQYKKLVSYSSLANACAILLQARIHILTADLKLDISPGSPLTIRSGFRLFAIPAPSSRTNAGNLKVVPNRKSKTGNEGEEELEELTKIFGIRPTTKDVGNA